MCQENLTVVDGVKYGEKLSFFNAVCSVTPSHIIDIKYKRLNQNAGRRIKKEPLRCCKSTIQCCRRAQTQKLTSATLKYYDLW